MGWDFSEITCYHMKDFEAKYKNLEAMLRHNAKTILLSIEAQNVSSTYELFVVFYKWINMDNLFMASVAPVDKKTFEKFNIEEFRDFFCDQNYDWDKIMPSYKVLRMFFWHVLNNGFEKHIGHIKKLHPEIFDKKNT